ncbi:MAG TPA: hypothetical protein VLM11_08990 [Streptosporangiaceae bacterium]|nr:hypothetical protein [Streptosporangiaceae bacterium]
MRRTGLSLRLARLAAAAVMAALPGLLSSCAGSGAVSGTSASASNASNGNVITLNKISTLKSLFNRDDGRARLILIFSPT